MLQQLKTTNGTLRIANMADWEEVKQLAADFQKAQLTTTKQRLSDRNVIEIVTKLIELKLIEVIYTIDGKEYLTHQELLKEIKDELIVHGGRINLVELQQILNVDYKHIETKATELIKHDVNTVLVLGQLIDNTYLDTLAEEVNDRLQDQGLVTIAELTTLYDLPADFLSEHVHARIGRIILGHVDSYDKDVIFTDAFIARMKANIRGAFSAISRPTIVGSIMNRYNFQERLFFSILEELVNKGKLAGTIAGGRQEKAVYVPNIYTRTQNEWVDAFYHQNGYLEYDSLSRLDITDPKGFIKTRFKSEPLTYLESCCAGVGIKEQIDVSVEEALQNNTWVDIMPLLPSVFSLNDANQLLYECTKNQPSVVISCDTIVTSKQFVTGFGQIFKDIIAKKADKHAKTDQVKKFEEGDKKSVKLAGAGDGGATKEDRKDQRKKKAQGSTKSGGGTQGREVKTKSLKKKARGKDTRNDSDDEGASSSRVQEEDNSFMTVEEVEDVLKKQKELRDCPDEFITNIAAQLHRPLTKQFHEVSKSIFLEQTGVATGSGRKKTHGELQEKISGLWVNCKLFEKGICFFLDETQGTLVKHLQKTVCTDIVNIVVSAIATEHMVSVSEETQLTPETRAVLISKLPEKVQPPVTKLHTSLTGKSLDDFFNYLEVICGPEHLGVTLKKPDKRKERQLVFNHRQSFVGQLNQEEDAAMTLHLTSVLLFQLYTQCIVHCPGKCVPQVIVLLKDHMEKEKHQVLLDFQGLVVQQMKLQGNEEKKNELSEVEAKIEKLLPEVKEIAVKTKKSAQES